ncbi:MAG: extracellular solute-binding protein [Fimbriimonas sp.]
MRRVLALAATLGVAAFACADPVTIRFACSGSNPEGMRLLKAEVARFEAAHPNIRVKVEPVVDAASYENKLLSQYAANVAPDCATLNANRLSMFATRGALKPLTDFPDLHGTEVDLKGRYPNAVDAYTIDGKLYAIPRDVPTSALIYYNKRAFDEAKIPYPDGTWTWDTKIRSELREKDFVWVMQRLTKTRPGVRLPDQYGFTTAWPQLWMDTVLISSGVRMWDDDNQPTKLFLSDPAVVDVYQFAADCVNKHHWMPSFNDVTLGAQSTMQDEFRKGKIAMLQSGPWEVKDMRKKHLGDWDVAAFPRFARGKESTLPGQGNGVGIFKTSRYPQETWAWIKWYTGRAALTEMAKAGESVPAIEELARTPGAWLPAPGATGVAAMPKNLGVTAAMAGRVRYRRLPEYFAGIQNELEGSYFAVLSGERKAAELLKDLQTNLPNKLALARRRIDTPPYPVAAGFAVAAGLVGALLAWIYLPAWRNRGRSTKAERAENRSAYLFLIPWICGLTLTVGPMIYSLLLSFADSDIIRPPRWRGLGNYADLLDTSVDDSLLVSLKQTLIFASLSIPIGLTAALSLALLLNQKVKGVPVFRALFYLPSLASGVAASLIWMKLFEKDKGIINLVLYGPDGKSGLFGLGPALSNFVGTPGEQINWLGNTKTVIPAFIIMGLWGAGGGTIIFLAGLQGISQTYYEAATLDGAGIWRKFRNVTLPLLTPTLFFSLITGVIGALQVFSQAFVITGGGPDRATMFVMVLLYGRAFGELKMGNASAIAWVLFVIILAITLVQFVLARKWVYYEGDLK